MRIAIFFVFYLMSCSIYAQETFTAGFVSDSIIVDGKADEWPVPFRFSDYVSKIAYNIKNDQENLYLCFKTDYRPTVMKILQLGFDMYIDTSGKKRKDWHIQFPIPFSQATKRNTEEKAAISDEMAQAHLRMKSDIDAFIAEGLLGLPNQKIQLQNEYGIRAAIDFDKEHALIMEFAIPLIYIARDFKDSKKAWSVTFKLNAPPAPLSTIGGNGGMGNTDRRGGLSPNSIGAMNGGALNNSVYPGDASVPSTTPNQDLGQNNADNDFDDANKQGQIQDASYYESSEWRFKLFLGTQ